MGHELKGLSYDSAQGLWQLSLKNTGGGRECHAARHVISSAPVAELMSKIHPSPRSLKHAVKLRYRDFVTVALMLKKPEMFADNWIYIHDPTVRVGRVQNFGSWSREMVPALHLVGRNGMHKYNNQDHAMIRDTRRRYESGPAV